MTADPTIRGYLSTIGVPPPVVRTCPFDPGYDLGTLRGHLEQSAHLMAVLKVSMACWMLADEQVSRAKVRLARAHGVPVTCGGGPFEVAVVQGRLPEYLDLVADMGFTRIEAGQGFTDIDLDPHTIVQSAASRGLEVQYELGGKHDGPLTAATLDGLVRLGDEWLQAGAVELVIEGREDARAVGLFDSDGAANWAYADRIAVAFGLETVTFEAPTKATQFQFLDHFGPTVRLSNVRLEELLRVEIYRCGLHSDAFANPLLRPSAVQPLQDV
ncbi:MAG TPA: phosphosulfolactate synthase [Nocardioidaceae bacterium]|nr:phosphosulfolactate synthase [Nocardioidaceae bacterium]